jgi:hypothetical protein
LALAIEILPEMDNVAGVLLGGYLANSICKHRYASPPAQRFLSFLYSVATKSAYWISNKLCFLLDERYRTAGDMILWIVVIQRITS